MSFLTIRVAYLLELRIQGITKESELSLTTLEKEKRLCISWKDFYR